MTPPTDRPVARVGRAPMAPGRERSGPPERRSLAPRSATITVMIRAAFAAAKNLKRDFGEVEHLQISEKGPGDFVSHADIKAERTLRAELTRTRPEYGFLGEEGGETKGDGRNRWIVDPLDGTTNFLHGVPHFAISIGLEREGKIVAGLIYNPANDEIFSAERGKGAFLNNRRIRVAARKRLADAIACCALPHHGRGDLALFRREMAAIQDKVAGLRRFGAAALDLAYVAAGRFDAYWERGLSPWDFAAGVLLVREAGGFVTDLADRERTMEAGDIIAGNEFMHRELLGLLAAA